MNEEPQKFDSRCETVSTGSHEEFWTFNQVSQWGSIWRFSTSKAELNQVMGAASNAQNLGKKCNCRPRLIHYAQLLIWRFYCKEKVTEYPVPKILPIAFECAAQILEEESPRQKISATQSQMEQQAKAGRYNQPQDAKKTTEFMLHFILLNALDFNIRIHHPSDYLSQFIGTTYETNDDVIKFAEAIISDSFLNPCCLLHSPAVIAEGAAIMAAGMLNRPDCVTPKTAKSLSFIEDMKGFYKASQAQNRYPQ